MDKKRKGSALIHPTFPPQGTPAAAYEGSQSLPPNKPATGSGDQAILQEQMNG